MTIHRDVNPEVDWNAQTRSVVMLLNGLYPDFTFGTYNGHQPHKTRAIDAFVPAYRTAAGKARGWVLARYVWANRARFNVWYVIFDGKIISQTRPSAGWTAYRPSAAAIRRSVDIAYHRDHVHVSTYASAAPTPAPVYLPTHYVDPAKVSTYLWGVKHATGVPTKQRKPGFAITTGVRVLDLSGDKWLLTDAGYRYHTDYLTTVKPIAGTETYKVKAGDTLSGIAADRGTTWQELAKLNPDIDPDSIDVGQELRVPAGEPDPAPPPPPSPKPSADVTNGRFVTLNAWDNRDLAERIPLIAALLADLRGSVVALQEFGLNEYPKTLQLLGRALNEPVWQRVVSGTSNNGRGGFYKVGNRVVIWRPSRWELRDRKSITLQPDSRGVPAVLLRSRSTGAEAWFFSVHLTHKAENAAVRQRQVNTLIPWLAKLGPQPKIGGYDLNSHGTVSDPGPIREALRKAGHVDLIELTGRAEPTHGRNRLDEVTLADGATLRAASVHDTGPATDHQAILVQYSTPNPQRS